MCWSILRVAAAGLLVAAVAVQAVALITAAVGAGRSLPAAAVDYFGYFTVLANLSAVVALGWAAAHVLARPATALGAGCAGLLACATTYMVVTGLVYNALLRGMPAPPGHVAGSLAWTDTVVHVVGPAFLLVDMLVGAGVRALPWRTVVIATAFPLAWVAVTLAAGRHPYPFLDPANFASGGLAVAGAVAAIGVVILLVAALTVGVARRRALRRERRRRPRGDG